MALATIGATFLAVGTAGASAATGTPALLAGRPAFLAHATDVGPVAASQRVDFEVLLAYPNERAVEAEAQAISSPGNALFRHFLTTAQFQARYSPSPAAVSAVESWTKSAGLSVVSVARSRLYVEVAGTMGQAEKLVGTRMDVYRYDGKNLNEPVADYRVPAGLAHTVDGIVDLDSSGTLAQPADTLPGPPPGVRYGVQPCSDYYGQVQATDKPEAYGKTWPYTICGYGAKQYESAFGLSSSIAKGLDGNGVTVAIVDAYAAPTILSDANEWSTDNGIAPFATNQFTQDTPGPDGYNLESECGPQGWYGEETLDVESVHAMAPGANVLFVGAKNCGGGLNKAWASVIDDHLASVETDSWLFGPEDLLTSGQLNFFNEFLLEAANTGVTVQFSSGDSGDQADTNYGKSVNFPASDPWATGVGGTSTEIGGNGKIVFQTGWSNSYSTLTGDTWTPAPPGNYSSGAGGGTSILYSQPFYQVGLVPTSISEYYGNTPMRAVPDISMPADPNTGLLIGETQTFPHGGTKYATYRLGGTSLSSPLFAGVLADAIQNTGSAVGFINPLVYDLSGTSAISDVLPTSSPQATVRTNYTNDLNPSQGYTYLLQTIGVPTQIYTLPGYDDMTGVGTPNGTAFLNGMRN
ncbi:MAG: S53 family peptidase [Acidimicrobiales bacterium]